MPGQEVAALFNAHNRIVKLPRSPSATCQKIIGKRSVHAKMNGLR